MEAHLAHNQEYAGSSPVSATLLLLQDWLVSDQEMLNLKNKHGDMYKVALSYYKAATV